MESTGDALRQQLHEIERGESASWVVYPPTPPWWPVGFGLWAAAFTLAITLLDDAAQALAQLALTALLGVAMAWDRRRRGTYPTGRPPRELRAPIARMAAGAALVCVLAWLVDVQVGAWPAAVVAAACTWVVVAFYEHEYAVVAAGVRERLA